MNRNKTTYSIALVSLVAMVIVGYVKWGESVPSTSGQTTRPEGWAEETHGNNVAPDYDIVFPQDKVNQIKITIAPSDWEAMQANMNELFGSQGDGQPGALPGAGGQRPGPGEFPDWQGQMPGTGNASQWDRQVPDPDTPPFAVDIPQGDNVAPGVGPWQGGDGPQAGNTSQWNQQVPDPDAAPMPGDLPERGNVPPGIGPGAGGDRPQMPSENPIWVPATVEFDGLTWTNVGVRYKGASSLTSGWRSGTPRLPLKLDFDEFEDEYPGIDNQRFYGFKQLSLSNSFADSTYMRDEIAARLLREAGLPAAQTSYYEVIMDYGEGAINLGLYIMIEVIDDTAIKTFFGNDTGNIYEGEGPAASLAQGTLDEIESSFRKENNTQEADWSDIEALYNALHSGERTSDPEAWRATLESIFDVNVFLEWLAISAIMEHWDSYGIMSQNFYLYNDPASGRLTWISWDHNMVLGVGVGGGAFGGRGRSVSLDREEVGQNWPLIRYLLDDPVYYALYVDYIQETVDGVFDPEKLETECWRTAALIGPYAVKESSEAAFESAVQELINRIYERYDAATEFLAARGM